MEVEENKWYDGFVMSGTGSIMFVVMIECGVSAIIDKRKGNSFGIELGTFLKVKASLNPNVKPGFKAIYIVQAFEKLPPITTVRIVAGPRSTDVYVRTTATVCGTTTFNTREIYMLENDIFGSFIDLENKIPNGSKEVEFEFKCRSSPLNEYSSIFVPMNFIRHVTKPAVENYTRGRSRSRSAGPPRKLNGFVGYDCDTHFWVWTRELPNDVILNKAHCVPNRPMIGRWVSMLVEKCSKSRYKVCRPVEFIENVLPTRLENDVPELRTELVNHGEVDGGYKALFSNVVGNVVDVHEMCSRYDRGCRFEGWVARHKWDDTTSRWKVSPKQKLMQPIGDVEEILVEQKTLSRSETKDSQLGGRSTGRLSRAASIRSMRSSTYSAAMGNDCSRTKRDRYSSDEEDGLQNGEFSGDEDDGEKRSAGKQKRDENGTGKRSNGISSEIEENALVHAFSFHAINQPTSRARSRNCRDQNINRSSIISGPTPRDCLVGKDGSIASSTSDNRLQMKIDDANSKTNNDLLNDAYNFGKLRDLIAKFVKDTDVRTAMRYHDDKAYKKVEELLKK